MLIDASGRQVIEIKGGKGWDSGNIDLSLRRFCRLEHFSLSCVTDQKRKAIERVRDMLKTTKTTRKTTTTTTEIIYNNEKLGLC